MVKYYPDLKLSESDNNKYKAFKLDNDLMVYLIQNEEAEKAGASLQCHVGSLRDPREYQGLAHFLEHMLFIGSEKYPGEGEYMTFLGQNGGYSNAYTSNYVTNYHFEIKDDKLLHALDMFAQFFISPLFKDESVFKEINAVNSEAEMYYNNDMWRRFHLSSLLCDPKAEMSKYNVGNLDTLGNLRGHLPLQSDKDKKEEPSEEKPMDPAAVERKNGLVQALKDFHKKYYSANQMCLCVYTKGSLDELEKQVIEIFSGIENKKIEYENFKNEIQPFPQETLSKFVKVVPINKGNSLTFNYRLKEYDADKFAKSGEYISHLIGHESKGSILDLLAEEGLALEISSGFSRYEDYMSNFSITVKLTSKGKKKENINKVIATVGSYVNMLKKEGPQDWVYDEIKTQNDLNFKYKDTNGGVSKCISLVSTYSDYEEPENVLYNGYEYRGFNKDTVQELVGQLTTDNLHMYYVSDELVADDDYSLDPIYGTRYQSQAIRDDMVKAYKDGDLSWSSMAEKIHLPEKNTFLPKNFDLKPVEAEEKAPKKIKESECSAVWHWQDFKFKLPKVIAFLEIYLHSGVNLQSAKNSQMLVLWSTLLEDRLRSLAYMAEMAKINSSIGSTRFGYSININCFNESLKPYAEKLAAAIKEFKEEGFTEEKFNARRESTEQGLMRQKMQAPFRYVLGGMIDYLQDNMFSNTEALVAIRDITYQEMVTFSSHIFDQIRFEWLLEGNITAAEAIEVADHFDQAFTRTFSSKTLSKDDVNHNRVAILDANRLPIVELVSEVAGEKNSAFFKVYQICNGDEYSAELNFIQNWLKSPYFEDLRTQQQLGYAVFALNRVYGGVRHFGFCIQSDVKSNHFCIERTWVFIQQMHKEIQEMASDKFEEIRSGVLANLKEPNKTLSEQQSEDLNEIRTHQYKFDRRKELYNLVEKVTKDDILKLYEHHFISKPRSFELHLYSQATLAQSEEHRLARQEKKEPIVIYTGAQQFKNSCELYVDTYSKL